MRRRSLLMALAAFTVGRLQATDAVAAPIRAGITEAEYQALAEANARELERHLRLTMDEAKLIRVRAGFASLFSDLPDTPSPAPILPAGCPTIPPVGLTATAGGLAPAGGGDFLQAEG